MTEPIDFAALDPALAAFVTERHVVCAFAGDGGTFVAFRPFDDEDIHICTLRDKPTRVLLEVVRERDANWGDRAAQVARQLADGVLVPIADGAHLVINEQLLGAWQVTVAAEPTPAPANRPLPDPLPDVVDDTLIDTRLTEQLVYSDLAQWPALPAFVSSEQFVDGYVGPRGIFVVYRMGSYGGIDFRNVAIVTMRGNERLLVWLLLDDPQSWSDEDSACACAWALADGLIASHDHGGELVVDEFDADKATDAF